MSSIPSSTFSGGEKDFENMRSIMQEGQPAIFIVLRMSCFEKVFKIV